MRSELLSLTIAFLMVSLATGCRRDDTVMETFVRKDEAVEGEYEFRLPLADSLAVYDIFLYSRIDGEPVHNLPLYVKWISPSDEIFAERIFWDVGGKEGKCSLYRSDVAPRENGNWLLVIKDLGAYETLAGIGIICKRKDGTR